MSADRIKQVLMGIGLLTVIGALAMAGLIAYLWWDAGRQTADIEADFEADDDFDVDADVDTEAAETEAAE